MRYQSAHIEESDTFTLRDVRIGEELGTIKIHNTELGRTLLTLDEVITIVIGQDGLVEFERNIPGRDREYLQYDSDGRTLVFLPSKPFKGTGRRPFKVETGLQQMIKNKHGIPYDGGSTRR